MKLTFGLAPPEGGYAYRHNCRLASFAPSAIA